MFNEKTYFKNYYKKHKKKLKAYTKQYRREHKEKVKKWNKKTRDSYNWAEYIRNRKIARDPKIKLNQISFYMGGLY
jgi:hypothetical protein